MTDKIDKNTLLNSKTFCMAPWTTMHFWPNGEAFPCCVMLPDDYSNTTSFMGNLKDSTVSELWNIEKMKQLRTNIIQDKPSNDCKRCYEQEKSGNIYTLRKDLNNNFADKYFQRVLDTNEDGSHNDPQFIYWDVRFNNLCNLKCLSCGPNFSSSWYDDAVIIYGHKEKAYQGLDKSFWNDALELIENVKHAYFAGGEPLMTLEHYKMLDVWIAAKNTDLRISYTTNFTQTKLGKLNIFDYWQQFTNVSVGASLDDNWERAEYLRKGTVWTNIVKNRKEMIAQCPDTEFFLSSTIGMYNILHFPDFHREWIEEGLVAPDKLNLTILTHPTRMSSTVLPEEYKKQVEEKWIAHAEYLERTCKSKYGWSEYNTQNITTLLKYMRSEDNCTALIDEFHSNTVHMDNIRKIDAYKVYPELNGLKKYGNYYDKQ
tara:strand:- start:8347 stop:9630 length:1284 start_codon:yes stop_codon:yes gene_type:complete